MLKKIFTTFILLMSSLFIFSNNVYGSTTTFTNTNAYSTFFFLLSDVIVMNQDADVFTFDIPTNDFTVYELGGVYSEVIFFTNDDGTGTFENIRLEDLDDTLSVNKLYSVLISNLSITPLSVKLQLMHNSSQLPAGFDAFMSDSTEHSFEAPYAVIYYSEGSVYFSSFYINTVPQPTDPTKVGFVFQYWKDINGVVYNYQLPPQQNQLDEDDVFYLEAVFFVQFTIIPPGPPGTGVNTAIDTILFNTGFFNTPGFVLLYFLLTILLNLGLWNLGSPTIGTLIGNIVLTSLFMFLGYLPLYVSALMIILFITIGITQSKGGMFSE